MPLMLECGSCGATLKVPESMAGRKVRCSACKAILAVPAAEAAAVPGAPEASRASEPAPPPIPGPEAEPRESDAGGGEPDAEGGDGTGSEPEDLGGNGERTERKKRTARRGAGEPGKRPAARRGAEGRAAGASGRKTSRVPFWALLGGGGLVAAALVGAVVLALGGGGGGETGGPGEEPETPGAGGKKHAETPAKPEDKALEAFREAVSSASTASDWFAAGEKARLMGRTGDARRLFLQAATLDPSLEKAWEALGYRRYSVPAEYRHLLESSDLSDTLKRWDGRWIDPRKHAEISASEVEILGAAQKVYLEMEKYRTSSNLDEVRRVFEKEPGHRDRVWGSRVAPPYFLFDERGPKGGKLMSKEDSQFLVNKKLRMLAKLYRYVTERWMQPLGFRRDENQLLVGSVFQNSGTFREFNTAIGTFLPPGAVAYFSRMSTFIYLYDAMAQDQERQDELDGILFHEGTHQIVAAFLRAGSGMERVTYWFNEGIAEYVGSVKRKYDDEGEPDWDFGTENAGRISEFQNARFPDFEPRFRADGITQAFAFTLKEMLSFRFPGQAMETIRRKIPPAAWAKFEGGGAAGSLIYAQAYFLLYYCYSCGKPERVESMDRYLAKEFKGQGGPDAFRDAFGLKTEADFTAFEKEWLEGHDSKVPDFMKKKR